MDRLTTTEIERVRQRHPITDVLRRFGVEVPAGHGVDFKISCPSPAHPDSTPSCLVHTRTDRFICFGCHIHGDVFSLVREITGIGSLAQIAVLLDSGPRHPQRSAIITDLNVGRGAPTRRPPEPSRTALASVMAVNESAWQFLTEDRQADRARGYLRSRGINVEPLESDVGRRLVGHTPYVRDGLVQHLQADGFTEHEILDSGWARLVRDQLLDHFRHRVMLPACDENGNVVGAYGRDITGTSSVKYLNTAETIAFHKSHILYAPRRIARDHPSSLLVCEGPIDALAVACAAVKAYPENDFEAVAPSGTALTAAQAELIARLSTERIVICTDADGAGRSASTAWRTRLLEHGRQPEILALPPGHDPASWIAAGNGRRLIALIRQPDIAIEL